MWLNFKYSPMNTVAYARLLAKLTCHTYSSNNPCVRNYVRSNCLGGKYTRESPSCGLYLSNPFGRLLAVLGERKKKLEDQYIRHSNDLVELVFKKWQDSTCDLVDNDLFPNACEHLDSGYHDLWDAWFSELEKKEGYKALSLQCDKQKESIRKDLGNKIKDAITGKFQYVLNVDQLNFLVDDIYNSIGLKARTGQDPPFYFEVQIRENLPASIVSLWKENKSYYRAFHYLENSSGSNFREITKILNSMLSNAKFNDAMNSLELKKAETAKKLEQFRDGLKSIISTATYEFKGIEGKCRRCKDWKP